MKWITGTEEEFKPFSEKLGTVQGLIHRGYKHVHEVVVQLASEGRRAEITSHVEKLYPVEFSNEHQDGGNRKNASLTAQAAIRYVPNVQEEIML